MNASSNNNIRISARSFLVSLLVIFVLMTAAYILTLIIPSGVYARIIDEGGRQVIDVAGGFSYTEGGLPFWKWILSPLLVLTASGSGTLIAVIAFLLVIGGVFSALEHGGLMRHMLDRMVQRFGSVRYRLMALLILFFMAMGAAIGSFEECVPLVPIVVALSVHLGWDAFTGVAMSLLAVGCGFASGVCNPFTVGVAQQLAGLPMFSGAWLRLLSFCLIYLLLLLFVRIHAKKIERPLQQELSTHHTADVRADRGLALFGAILGVGIAVILCSGFIPALQDFTMIIVAVTFLLAGVVSTLACGMSGRQLTKSFSQGVVSIFPAVIMILMASSIKYTLEEARVLDTILHGAVGVAETLPQWAVILFIYLIVLVMNFFIPSGSAKAFMLMPLIVPLAQIFHISTQLCVVAFAFGDGFSNVLYPTNPALLISLSLADVSYSKWFRWTWKFHALNLLLTSALLLFGLAVGY